MSSTAVGKMLWEDRSKEPPSRGSFLILPNKTVLVGRDETRNHVSFADPVVSRCQLEIFCIITDEEYKHPPLVFVRDRGSSNGTAVNGELIGRGPQISPSWLLEDGDTITIGPHPHLMFTYTQLSNPQPSYTLSHLQQQEVKLFSNRYVVTNRTIGDGGHAVVFLAVEVETGRHVACKVHDISRFSPTSKEVERTRQEALLLSTLDHPNILPIKAAFETQQTIYVITELATGGDLYSLLMRLDQLDEWAIRSIIRQVLRGLAYIHSKGVAHRDIKTENILCGITPNVPYRIMLSDFGASGLPGRRRLRSSVGTPFYRPPECDVPGHGHDLSVDIWAVGMLTLQLFLGFEEFPRIDSVVFRSQEDIDAYLTFVFATSRLQGRISEPAKCFIYGCLGYDSARRPTASQAFSHGWLQEPKSDRKMFKRLEADNALSWKPQRVSVPVIEDLTAMSAGKGRSDTVSAHFMAPQQAEADLFPKAHIHARLLAEKLVPPSGLEPEQVLTKRKHMSSSMESAKRQRPGPS
ncbi:kinase-like protein [Parathielavia appendiculata]|uniref:Kinase-like protein n=1 Tax=Parathielavia appendiculata TaxID=2587402 RepID=A0AAN6U0K0_9PEZI|nr:kinase-like protein [Parathielavia appendiculata]